MNTSIEKFLEKLANDENLRKEMAEAQQNLEGKDPETIFNEILKPIINKSGFDFSFEDLQKMKNQNISQRQLNENELEEVSGGEKKGLACVLFGGGKGGSCFGFGFGEGKNQKKCVCFFGGGGKF